MIDIDTPVGGRLPLRIQLRDRIVPDTFEDLTNVTVTCRMKSRTGSVITVSDWVPDAAVGGKILSGVLWFSPANLATADLYSCTLEATKAGNPRGWPTRQNLQIRVDPVV